MKVAATAGVLLTAVGLVHLSAKSAANRIRSNPDPYSYEQLCEEPIGETVVIRCHDGTEIRANAEGAGPTVVLAHGYGQSLREWNILWTLLRREGYRVIAFDQRGHGQSTIGSEGMSSAAMAADYKAVLEHFDVREAILVGHSMGAFLSIVFMLTYPDSVVDRVRGVVLIGGLAGDSLKGAPQNRVQIPLLKAGVIDWAARSDTYKLLLGGSFCGSKPSPAVVRACMQAPAQGHRQILPILAVEAQENYYDRLGEITVPCAVVCGRADRTTPSWHSTELGTRIPQARNIWIDGKGHFLNWEAPELLRDTIQSF